jgi:hypothetical protein
VISRVRLNLVDARIAHLQTSHAEWAVSSLQTPLFANRDTTSSPRKLRGLLPQMCLSLWRAISYSRVLLLTGRLARFLFLIFADAPECIRSKNLALALSPFLEVVYPRSHREIVTLSLDPVALSARFLLTRWETQRLYLQKQQFRPLELGKRLSLLKHVNAARTCLFNGQRFLSDTLCVT